MPKMIMDDLMIMNDLDGEFRCHVLVPPLGTILAAFSQNTFIWNCSF